mmetsp:Transcript_7586/g.13671  ORF Transcript_7586/g.13671 Transcript_7586/m.13671 type:complete len:170 (-) Transcript_7586:60-569(-)|eukprot:CAMPEP_0182490714 /NCGR_PEP_ID=MMETSP1321-20130603/476_1 /TAXON_ID=91990 /ORGANISM="Bolidomonas sp., Strain RCC1657" /LENGTH=169 /DNA_ID=CAMNT_0024692939 /DNA_START=22 /DNA_END=531 /DNA_ORIENTATION=+
MTESEEVLAARKAMIAKRFGGKTQEKIAGGVRRKKKAATRSTAGETDRKLSAAVKKLGATNIPGIEEVNLFRDDGKVIHFANPKVQASISANTYIVSGNADTVGLESLLPGVVSQMGPEMIQQLQAQVQAMGAAQGLGPGANATADDDSDDDEVPDLVEGQDFEAASNN